MKSAFGHLALAYLGGIRSGKSELAQERFSAELEARALRSPAHFGTLLDGAAGSDRALAERLAAHRRSRPEAWASLEVGADLVAAGERALAAGHDAWLLDGLGAWAALHLDRPQAALASLGAFLGLAARVPLLVLVLDEVGQGGVPGHPAARAFADLNGSLNRAACSAAGEAWAVQAGLALRLK